MRGRVTLRREPEEPTHVERAQRARPVFWGGCENQESLTAPPTSIGDRRRFGRPQLTVLRETLHLHASHSVPPFSPREGGGTWRACLLTFPASLGFLFPQGARLWAAGETRHHGSVSSAQTVLTPTSPKLESWLYFVRSEGEVKLHRSSPPGVSQDEGVQEVCSVRRPRGCGPWGILLRRRRGQGKKLQDGTTDKLEACLMGQTQAMGEG